MGVNRDALSIRVWLLQQRLSQADVASRLGFCRATVNKTVHGHESNRAVLSMLLKMGCPRSHLEPLPEDMRERLKAMAAQALEYDLDEPGTGTNG